MSEKTALVLSAGGMFGAYQAGAWSVLAAHFEPDIVIGTSVGALNGWAIAGGCSGDQLIRDWTHPETAAFLKPCVPLYPWRGFFKAAPFEARIENLFLKFAPRLPFGLVVTDVLPLRSRLVQSPNISWQHLAAACTIPGGLKPVRVDGQWCVDGGMLGALPLWAAIKMGATRVIAINALPLLPSRTLRAFVSAVRCLAGANAGASRAEVITIFPQDPLGSVKDLVIWNRDNVMRWIDAGAEDARKAIAGGALSGISPNKQRVLQ